jgi:hypothetical protein
MVKSDANDWLGRMQMGGQVCAITHLGLSVYDSEEKLRLKTTYQAQEEAEVGCQRLNLERLQNVLSERESMTAL